MDGPTEPGAAAPAAQEQVAPATKSDSGLQAGIAEVLKTLAGHADHARARIDGHARSLRVLADAAAAIATHAMQLEKRIAALERTLRIAKYRARAVGEGGML